MKLMNKLFIVAVCVCASFSTVAATKMSGKAHDFTLASNQGKNFRLNELKGQVVMINFWASWCGPCRQEMPLLEEIYARYNPAGFTLLSVFTETDKKKADDFLKDVPVSFPVLYDFKSDVSEMYDVDSMPFTVIIDRNGNMRYRHRGYKAGDEKEYRSLIRELIRE